MNKLNRNIRERISKRLIEALEFDGTANRSTIRRWQTMDDAVSVKQSVDCCFVSSVPELVEPGSNNRLGCG